MLSTRDPPQNKGHIQTESEGLEKDISCKWRPKKAGVAILMSDKTDFDGMEREAGGGIGMGNTCKSMADSRQCGKNHYNIVK